jgi:hypothetical protein
MSDDFDEFDNKNSVVEFKKPATSYARPDGGKRSRVRDTSIPKAPSAKSMKLGVDDMGDDFDPSYMDGNWGMIIGQHIACKILGRDRLGYNVVIEGGRPGFLKTDQRLTIGKKMTVEFICVMDDLALLATLPEQKNSALKGFGLVEDASHGCEIVQLFGAKKDGE